MCEICIKVFNKSENCSIAQKSRGLLAKNFLHGGLRKFCCTGGAEPLGGGLENLGEGFMQNIIPLHLNIINEKL